MAKSRPTKRQRHYSAFGLILLAKRGTMSREKLAEKAGVSATYINMLENGERKRPSWDIVKRLADALSIDIKEFDEVPTEPAPGSALQQFIESGIGGEITPDELARMEKAEVILGLPPTPATYLRLLDLIRSGK